jgi:hypothetical protein
VKDLKSENPKEELKKIVENIKFKPEIPYNCLFTENNLRDFVLAKSMFRVRGESFTNVC